MKKYLSFLFLFMSLSPALLRAEESLMNSVDELIAEGLYLSAWEKLHEQADEEHFADIVVKKTELCLRYYSLSNMHQTFAFSDLKEGETLETVRREGKAGDMRLFDPTGALSEAIRREPERGDIDFWLGEYYFDVLSIFGNEWIKTGEELKELILVSYRSALDKGEASEELYAHLSHIEMLNEQWAEAAGHLEAALDYNRKEAGYYHNLAAVQINLNRLPQAEVNAEQAFSLYSDPVYKADSLFLASTIALYREQPEKAEEYIRQGAALSPGDYRFPDRLIRLSLSRSDYAGARKAAGELFALYPENPENCTKIIQYFYSVGHLEEAEGFFDSQEKAFEGNPAALGNLYYHRGICYGYRKMPEQAVAAYGRAEEEFGKVYPADYPVFGIISRLKENPLP